MKRVWNISIHAPREGGDVEVPGMDGAIDLFQSTPPARGATLQTPGGCPPSCEGISIHAPREGGDTHWHSPPSRLPRRFQSTPPARGATPIMAHRRPKNCEFQSTPPARGATATGCRPWSDTCISIHAPRSDRGPGEISIHAPREGGDEARGAQPPRPGSFQSTPPARGATAKMHSFICESLINK